MVVREPLALVKLLAALQAFSGARLNGKLKKVTKARS